MSAPGAAPPEQPHARRTLWAFAPLAALFGVVIAGAVVLLSGQERQTVSDAVAGRALPAYALASLRGAEPVTPAAFAGRAYLINAFASWCAPCRVEHPQLMALAEAGVPILGLAYKDAPAAAAGFLSELGDPFTAVGLDPQGVFALELGVSKVPETFVVGADGRLAYVHRGPLTAEIVERDLLPALRAADANPGAGAP